MEKLLKGELNLLPVLRRYHQDSGRLGVPLPVHGVDRRSLRLPVVERIMTSRFSRHAAGCRVHSCRREDEMGE